MKNAVTTVVIKNEIPGSGIREEVTARMTPVLPLSVLKEHYGSIIPEKSDVEYLPDDASKMRGAYYEKSIF